MRRTTAFALVFVGALSASMRGQTATIEVRKVRTMVDRDGRGFTGVPRNIAALNGGRFVLDDDRATATRPVIIDSTGKFIRHLAPTGSGPGEIPSFAGPYLVGRGETLFVGIGKAVLVFDPRLKYVRSLPLESWFGDFALTDEGFVGSSSRPAPGGGFTPFHVANGDGRIIRSMGRDTFAVRDLHRFLITPSNDGFWGNQYPTHRFEKWTISGNRMTVIDTLPPWFYMMPRGRLAPFTTVRSIREVDGHLWVMSWVPSPRIDQIVREATGRSSRPIDGEGPSLPVERMYTTVLEVYDAATGKHIAELTLNALAAHFIGDNRFVIYSVNADDLAQLEIWEMRLKR